jgi:hypothetical protein
MPSRDNPNPHDSHFETDEAHFPIRATIEAVLHGLALIVLAFLIWQAVHALRQRPDVYAAGDDVHASLVQWTTRQAPERAHVALDSVPTPPLRDWLAAFPGAGTQTSWEGVSLNPTAVTVEPVADPRHKVRIWVAAPNKSEVALGDELGGIDSLPVASGGAVVTVPAIQGKVRATVGGTTATTMLRDSLTIKSVLVIGVASWEAKFIAASLEEYGWKVDARFGLSPKSGDVVQNVTQGNIQIDTSRYAAIVVLDTLSSRYASQIADYVRKGGGLIAAGDAASMSAFSELLPARAGGLPSEERDFGLDSVVPRTALALSPLTQLKSNAVAIEKRRDSVAVAAQRVGRGRVLQVGYHDTWRWRMGGTENTLEPFRGWWSTMVSSIAYAPGHPVANTTPVEPTPMASLVSILGKPAHHVAPTGSFLDDPRLLPFLFGLLMVAFLAEWASRRLRGQP